jgi:hypothetical protein
MALARSDVSGGIGSPGTATARSRGHALGLPRSAVTGIPSGSLQKVTIDRVRRLVEAAGLEADIRVRRAA